MHFALESANKKSQAIPEKLNFVKEKTTQREKIHYLDNILLWDMVYYCMDREQWGKVNQEKLLKAHLAAEICNFAKDINPPAKKTGMRL